MAGRLANLETWFSRSSNELMEIVIVHDIQDTFTASELDGLVNKYHHLKIKVIEGTFGSPGLARNAGLKISTSNWITFWDADDLPNPQNVLSAIAQANSQTEVIIGNFTIISPRGEAAVNHNGRVENVALNPGLWRMIFRSTALQGVNFCTTRMGEDQLFLIDLNLQSRKIHFSNLNFYHYFQGGPMQLTSTQNSINEVETTLILASRRLKENKTLKNRFSEIVLLRLFTTTIFKTKNTSRPKLILRYIGIVIKSKPQVLTSYILFLRNNKAERK
jgi:glycosyltransferase involved in cell wall biosynthesis